MRFTSFITATILAFMPIAPTFAIPLTVADINQSISVAPNGIIVPGPVDPPTETTDTGLPFDSHPDNLEDFPHIQDTSTDAHYRYRNKPTKHPLIDERMMESDGAMPSRKQAKHTERLHRLRDYPENPNFRSSGIGGHGPVAFPERFKLDQTKPTTSESRHVNHRPTQTPKIPAFTKGGNGPVVNPSLFSGPITAPKPAATYSNLTGGPIFEHARKSPHETAKAGAVPFRRVHPIGGPIGRPRAIARRGLDTENSASSWSESSAEQLSEPYPEFDAYKCCIKEAVAMYNLTLETYGIMNGFFKHIATSNESVKFIEGSQAMIRKEWRRMFVFLLAAQMKRHRLCVAIPTSQNDTIAPHDLESSDYEEAYRERIEVESQAIRMANQAYGIELLIFPSAVLQHAVTPYLKADLHSSATNGTSSSPDLNSRDSQATDGIWEDVGSSIVITAVNGPFYIVQWAGDAVLSQHKSEIESWAHKFFHPKKKPHNKPSANPKPETFGNSTSAQSNTTESNTFSRRQLVFLDMEIADGNSMAVAYQCLVSESRGVKLSPKVRRDLYDVLFKFNNTNTDSPSAREVARRLNLGNNCTSISTPNIKNRDVGSGLNITASNSTTMQAAFVDTLQYLAHVLETGNPEASNSTSADSDKAVDTMHAFVAALKEEIASATAMESKSNDIEKRQGDYIGHIEREYRMRAQDIKAQLSDKIDKKDVQELCASHPEIPDCNLANEYVQRRVRRLQLRFGLTVGS
jgi:hypothetical protein